MKLITLSLMLASVSACGSNQTDSQNSASRFVYDYEYNGCKTGSHSFNNLADLCSGLQNSALNNGCAYPLREEKFKESCPGTFVSK